MCFIIKHIRLLLRTAPHIKDTSIEICRAKIQTKSIRAFHALSPTIYRPKCIGGGTVHAVASSVEQSQVVEFSFIRQVPAFRADTLINGSQSRSFVEVLIQCIILNISGGIPFVKATVSRFAVAIVIFKNTRRLALQIRVVVQVLCHPYLGFATNLNGIIIDVVTMLASITPLLNLSSYFSAV